MSRLIALSALLVFAGAAPALAEEDELSRDGLYLGFLVPIAFQTEGGVDNTPGVSARGGYRFLRHFAGEVQFEWFPSRDIARGGSNIADLETTTFTANARGFLLTGRIQPYLQTGIGLMHINLDDKTRSGLSETSTDFLARFGGGVEIYVDTDFILALEANYMLPTGGSSDWDHVLVSAGVQYRF
jgi:opacity protein-like surface antigen